MQAVDFNSDMGEGFGPWTIGDGVDAQLMAYISSANIATGFHAGDPGTMRRTVERAKQLGWPSVHIQGFATWSASGAGISTLRPRNWSTTFSTNSAPCAKSPAPKA